MTKLLVNVGSEHSILMTVKKNPRLSQVSLAWARQLLTRVSDFPFVKDKHVSLFAVLE